MEEKTTITFLASECGEFHEMGESIECDSLKEAFRHYLRFCRRSPQMCPSLEFSLHYADMVLFLTVKVVFDRSDVAEDTSQAEGNFARIRQERLDRTGRLEA